jgi:hypothetical protein
MAWKLSEAVFLAEAASKVQCATREVEEVLAALGVPVSGAALAATDIAESGAIAAAARSREERRDR